MQRSITFQGHKRLVIGINLGKSTTGGGAAAAGSAEAPGDDFAVCRQRREGTRI